jgi:hypothetical protein
VFVLFSDIVTQDIPGKRQSGALKGDVQVYKRESMQYYHNVVGDFDPFIVEQY